MRELQPEVQKVESHEDSELVEDEALLPPNKSEVDFTTSQSRYIYFDSQDGKSNIENIVPEVVDE